MDVSELSEVKFHLYATDPTATEMQLAEISRMEIYRGKMNANAVEGKEAWKWK